jgi:hypothetical protein
LKKIGIIIAIIIIIAGGTVGVLKWLQIWPFSPNAVVVKEAPPPPPPIFVAMDPLLIPVFSGDKVAATFQIQFKLETTGKKNEDKITELLPRLNDIFLRDLYVFIPRLLRKNQNIDVPVIKRRLQLLADKLAGKGVINAILIQSLSDIQRR